MLRKWTLALGLLSAFGIQAAEIKIGSLVSGQVTDVFVKSGQTVKTGDALLKIDDRRFQAKLTQLEAEVAWRELALADLKIEFDQNQDMFDRTVIARRVYERAKTDYELALQALNKSKAELALHQAWYDYFHIKSPVNGKVKSIVTPKGSTVFNENQLLIILESE